MRSELGVEAPRDPLPETLLAEVGKVPGVEAAIGEVFTTAGSQILDRNGDAVGNPFAPSFLASWSGDDPVNAFRLIEGRAPSGADEVLLDSQAVAKGEFALGDPVRIQTAVGLETFRLTGTVRYGEAGNMGGASVALFVMDTAQRVAGRVGALDGISVRAAPGSDVDALQDRLQAAVDAQIANRRVEVVPASLLSEESNEVLQRGFGFFSTFLLAFAAIALFVGAFIVYNTFSIVVAQRTREFALTRALGASIDQVLVSVVVEAVAVGLAASLVGLVGGMGIALALKAVLDTLGFGVPTGALVVLPRTVLVSIVGGTVTTLVSAIGPAIRAARVPPLAAVRTLTPRSYARRIERIVAGAMVAVAGVALVVTGSSGGEIVLLGLGAALAVVGIALLAPSIVGPVVHVIGAPLRRLRDLSGQLAEENAARTPRRTATTASALMIGTALIAASLVLASSITRSTDKLLDQGLVAELFVRSPGVSGIGNQTSAALRADPDVAAVAAMRLGTFELGGSTKQLGGIDPALVDPTNPLQALDLDVSEGRITDLSDGGVAVSRNVATSRELTLGEALPVVLASGPQVATVEAIFDSTGFGDYLVASSTHQAWFPDSVDFLAAVKLRPGADVAAVQTRLATVVERSQPLAELQTREEYKGEVRARVTQMINLIYALVVLSVVIAILGVLITMLLSVLERTHELGLLRAIGMDRRDARAMVRWEAAIVSLFGAGLGVLTGIGLGVAFVRAFRDQGITELRLPLLPMAVLTLGITLAGVAASLLPAVRAGRLNVLTAIATQ
jgi:putative ABC transport system permease protein